MSTFNVNYIIEESKKEKSSHSIVLDVIKTSKDKEELMSKLKKIDNAYGDGGWDNKEYMKKDVFNALISCCLGVPSGYAAAGVTAFGLFVVPVGILGLYLTGVVFHVRASKYDKFHLLESYEKKMKGKKKVLENALKVEKDPKVREEINNRIKEADKCIKACDKERRKLLPPKVAHAASEVDDLDDFDFDFDDDWDNWEDIDIDVSESAPLETIFTTNPFEKEMTLFHGSSEKLSIIKPIGYNAGTKFSSVRVSSYWTRDIEFAKVWAAFRVLNSVNAVLTPDNNIAVLKSDYNDIINTLKRNKIYIYQKTLNKKYIGIGQAKFRDEFTVDVPVKPDKVYTFKASDVLDRIITVDTIEELDAIFNSSDWDKAVSINRKLVMHTKTSGKIIRGVKKDTLEINEDTLLETKISKSKCNPVYIITMEGNSIVSKPIKAFTHSEFSHSGISLTPDLSKIYSFNMRSDTSISGERKGGLSLESIKGYTKDNPTGRLKVNAVFLKTKDFRVLNEKLDYMIQHAVDTSYNAIGLFDVIINKVNDTTDNMSMICSQFVDYMFKIIDVDLTDKASNLVTPSNIAKIDNPKVYKVFDGIINEFKPSIIKNKLKKLYNKAEYIKEACIIFETNYKDTVSAELTDAGDLIISKRDKLNIAEEHALSKRMYPYYKKSNNIDAMKFEASKLYYMNSILTYKIEGTNGKRMNSKKEELITLRSKVMNEFALYTRYIQSKEPNFNFATYYRNSPFCTAEIKLTKNTIRGIISTIKSLISII